MKAILFAIFFASGFFIYAVIIHIFDISPLVAFIIGLTTGPFYSFYSYRYSRSLGIAMNIYISNKLKGPLKKVIKIITELVIRIKKAGRSNVK